MATEATMTLGLRISQSYVAPATGGGEVFEAVDNDTWGSGSGSGYVDQGYRVVGSLAASGTVTYNLLAAGSLVGTDGTTVDLDEVMGIVVRCLTGSIAVTGVASGLGCFTGADEGIKLSAGQSMALNFGASGLAVGANGSIKVTEPTTSAAATFDLTIVGAE